MDTSGAPLTGSSFIGLATSFRHGTRGNADQRLAAPARDVEMSKGLSHDA